MPIPAPSRACPWAAGKPSTSDSEYRHVPLHWTVFGSAQHETADADHHERDMVKQNVKVIFISCGSTDGLINNSENYFDFLNDNAVPQIGRSNRVRSHQNRWNRSLSISRRIFGARGAGGHRRHGRQRRGVGHGGRGGMAMGGAGSAGVNGGSAGTAAVLVEQVTAPVELVTVERRRRRCVPIFRAGQQECRRGRDRRRTCIGRSDAGYGWVRRDRGAAPTTGGQSSTVEARGLAEKNRR